MITPPNLPRRKRRWGIGLDFRSTEPSRNIFSFFDQEKCAVREGEVVKKGESDRGFDFVDAGCSGNAWNAFGIVELREKGRFENIYLRGCYGAEDRSIDSRPVISETGTISMVENHDVGVGVERVGPAFNRMGSFAVFLYPCRGCGCLYVTPSLVRPLFPTAEIEGDCNRKGAARWGWRDGKLSQVMIACALLAGPLRETMQGVDSASICSLRLGLSVMFSVAKLCSRKLYVFSTVRS